MKWNKGVPPTEGEYIIAILRFFVDEQGCMYKSPNNKTVSHCYEKHLAKYNEALGCFIYEEDKLASWREALWIPIEEPRSEDWRGIICF